MHGTTNLKLMKHYTPTGRRNHGRLLKRLLDTWDRNGSTSCPTPWQIDDDDDDDGDDDNICKYTRLNKHKFISHNMNFPSNICLRQQHCLPYTNKGTYPLQCTSNGVTDVGLIPGRLHAIETSLTWKYKDVQLVIKMQISRRLNSICLDYHNTVGCEGGGWPWGFNNLRFILKLRYLNHVTNVTVK
jgi:hypothetical protein